MAEIQGISSAIDTARAGLVQSEQEIATAAKNIDGVNDPNQPRRIVEKQVQTSGEFSNSVVTIAIKRAVNPAIDAKLRETSGELEAAKLLESYDDRLQALFGDPNSTTNLAAQVNDFFASVTSLANNPNQSSTRTDMIKRAESLMGRINSISQNIFELRFEADHEMRKTVEAVNEKLKQLQDNNKSLIATDLRTNAGADLLDTRDRLINDLAKMIDIKGVLKEDDSTHLTMKNGKDLIDTNRLELSYHPLGSVDAFVTNLPLSPLTGQSLDESGTKVGNPFDLISGGAEGEITSNLSGGRLHALQKIRDERLVEALTQLDMMASTVRDKFNAIHNEGVSQTPMTALTGTRKTTLAEERSWTGGVRIAVLDMNGLPATREDGTPLNPLLLDMQKIDGGNGKGKITTETLIKEINEYYLMDPSSDRTTLGGIYDIKIAATSKTIAPNGVFSFDFELDHGDPTTDKLAQFEVLGVTVLDSAATPVVGALTSALPSTYTILPGARERTGASIDVNLGAAPSAGGNYTVRTQVRVTDGNGIAHVAELDFTIDDTPTDTNVFNRRYEPSIFSGGAEKVKASTTQGYLQAQLLNENGNDATSMQEGILHLKTLREGHRIAIQEVGSRELGYSSGTTIVAEATNQGFSQYFGLNDFIINTYETRASAYHLKIREDISKDHGKLSMATLRQTDYTEEIQKIGSTQSKGSLTFTNNPDLGDTITIDSTTFTFVAAAVTDNQITRGASLSATLDNILVKLNAANPTTIGTVDKATYTKLGVSGINILHKEKGENGNLFSLSANFATIGGSVNGDTPSTTPSGKLTGGTNEDVLVAIQPHTYEISSGNASVIHLLSNLATEEISFKKAGNMPETTKSFSAYVAEITAFHAKRAAASKHEAKNVDIKFHGLEEKRSETSGINLEQELVNTTIVYQRHSGNGFMLGLAQKLFDTLLTKLAS